jgi:protein-tyrosine phosphatase
LNPKLYWIRTRLPGKLAVSARPRGGDWLPDEVEGWRKAGIDAVVSLLTDRESEEMQLQEEAAVSRTHGLRFLSLPIEDRGVPNSLSEAASVVAALKDMLGRGQNVAIHCRQGIGRSGMIAAAVLTTTGLNLDEALNQVSAARGLTVPETDEQRSWLFDFDSQATTTPASDPVNPARP